MNSIFLNENRKQNKFVMKLRPFFINKISDLKLIVSYLSKPKH